MSKTTKKSSTLTLKIEPYVSKEKNTYNHDKQLANFDKLVIFEFLKKKYPQLVNPIIETIINSKKILPKPKTITEVVENLCQEYKKDILLVYNNSKKDKKGNMLDKNDFLDVLNECVNEYLDKNYIKIKVDNDDQFDAPCGSVKHVCGGRGPEKDNTYIIWELNIKAPKDSFEYLKNLNTTICDLCKKFSDNEVYYAYHGEIFGRVNKKLGIRII